MTVIDGLLEERRGYVVHGNKTGIKEVDAELAKFGAAVLKDGTVQRPDVVVVDDPGEAVVDTSAVQAALVAERDGYIAAGDKTGIKEVDAELAKFEPTPVAVED